MPCQTCKGGGSTRRTTGVTICAWQIDPEKGYPWAPSLPPPPPSIPRIPYKTNPVRNIAQFRVTRRIALGIISDQPFCERGPCILRLQRALVLLWYSMAFDRRNDALIDHVSGTGHPRVWWNHMKTPYEQCENTCRMHLRVHTTCWYWWAGSCGAVTSCFPWPKEKKGFVFLHLLIYVLLYRLNLNDIASHARESIAARVFITI